MGAVSHATLTREDIKEFFKKHNITNAWVPDDGES
jgi:hypothetical protein